MRASSGQKKLRATPRSAPEPGDRIGSGHHPYYAIYEDGSWAVVKTDHGLNPRVVQRGLKAPRLAVEIALRLNSKQA